MSLSAVLHAVRQGEEAVTEMVVHDVKCFLQYVPSVVKKPKYHSSLVKADRYIVASVTVKSD